MKKVDLIPTGNSEGELELFEGVVQEITNSPLFTGNKVEAGFVAANIFIAIHLNLQKRGIKLIQKN